MRDISQQSLCEMLLASSVIRSTKYSYLIAFIFWRIRGFFLRYNIVHFREILRILIIFERWRLGYKDRHTGSYLCNIVNRRSTRYHTHTNHPRKALLTHLHSCRSLCCLLLCYRLFLGLCCLCRSGPRSLCHSGPRSLRHGRLWQGSP